MGGLESTNTHEGSLLSGLVPVFYPGKWANTGRILSVNLALIGIVSTLLHADNPFVVTVPAVKGLVLGWESGITGCGANVLDLVQEILLLFVKLGDFVAKNLQTSMETSIQAIC